MLHICGVVDDYDTHTSVIIRPWTTLKSPSLILGRFPFAAKTAHSKRVLNDDNDDYDKTADYKRVLNDDNDDHYDEDWISHDDEVGHSLVDVRLGKCLQVWEGGVGGGVFVSDIEYIPGKEVEEGEAM